MKPIDKFNAGILRFAKRDGRGLKPVLREDIPTQALYHVSTNPNIPTFIPMVCDRTVEGEDQRVPRICVSACLAECFGGYGRMFHDFDDPKAAGIWTIYGFDFEVAVKPSTALLPSQRDTREYWLIAYDEETTEWRPKALGTIRLTSRYTQRLKTKRIHTLEFVLDVKGEGVYFDNKNKLGEGYHSVVVSGWCEENFDLGSLKIDSRPIDEKTYNSICSGRECSFKARPSSASW